MPRQPPREALVLRFPPGGPDQVTKMRQEAKYVNRHHQKKVTEPEPWYRLSVWAAVAGPDETRLQLMQRLVQAAGLGRIRLDDERNSVFWWAEAGAIYDAGFEFHLVKSSRGLQVFSRGQNERAR